MHCFRSIFVCVELNFKNRVRSDISRYSVYALPKRMKWNGFLLQERWTRNGRKIIKRFKFRANNIWTNQKTWCEVVEMILLEEEKKMTHILDQVHAQLKIKENFLLILFHFSLDRLTLANTFTSIVNKNGSLKFRWRFLAHFCRISF